MAAVSISHPPVNPFAMANRRAPLANVPNAVNSPFRGIAAAAAVAATKRTRAQAGDQREVVLGQPPLKKQAVELLAQDGENVDPRKRSAVVVVGQDKLDEPFTRRRANAPPTELQQKLAAAREKKSAHYPPPTQPPPQQARGDRALKPTPESVESIRQWQKHYRRHFPTFVFYFESVPEEAREKPTAQFRSLGAKDSRFFSKEVTHVVTVRDIPPELEPDEMVQDATSNHNDGQSTIIPPSAIRQDQRRTTDLLDANLQRRATSYSVAEPRDIDPRKLQGQSSDVLLRARTMKIKIWSLEKLQRVLRTLLETYTESLAAVTDQREAMTAARSLAKPTQEADLEQLLRNEKVNGPADRDMTVAAQDMIALKGYYLYIHDMDERTKPVMVRDYVKPAVKEKGKWPQFRLTAAGRCPFVEDPAFEQKLEQQEREAQAAKAEQELASQRKTRGTINPVPPRALAERQANLRRSPRKSVQQTLTELSKPLDPPKLIPAKRQSSMEGVPHLFGSAQQSLRGLPRMIGGEPMASGMQQSNITSAIRSQVISSAAISSTAPGIPKRVADSKEVSALKRKVLEKGASVTSAHSMPSSYMNDVRAAINEPQDPPPRAAKRRAQETLGVVLEDNEDGCRPGHRGAHASKTRKPVEREPKAGYCENCRDKFEDFDEHVNSRKHRKFALTLDNWKELDQLLGQLRRPRRVV